VVGLGNPLSGDDCFGAQVVELLQRNGTAFLPGVSLTDAHTDLLTHIGDFAGFDRVVLVDAILDPEGKLGRPGRVVVLKEEAFLPWPETSQGVHQISPLLAVKLFRLLYPAAQTQIILAGLVVDRIDMAPRYVTAESVEEGAAAVQTLVG
jgi:hydrogenase maturation protease